MKSQTIPLFPQHKDGKHYGFLIVISPPPDVVTYVNELKREFYQRHGAFDSMHSKPHITICNFLLLEEREKRVFSSLQQGLAEIDPFMLELNGFGSFTHSNVIFLDVIKSEELESMIKKFNDMSRKLWLGKKFTLTKNSHLTIAKKIKPRIFEPATSEYLRKEYKNSFIVDRLKILRFDLDAGRYFDAGDLILGDVQHFRKTL